MAEASKVNTNLNITWTDLAKWIIGLIVENSLDKIKNAFDVFPPEQRVTILNTPVHGLLPLYVAINHNNVNISRYLLEVSLLQGKREMSNNWKHCQHPLVAAMNVKSSRLFRLILRQLPDIDEEISGPLTPLMLAISHGKITYIEKILDRGADINKRCWHGRTPLMQSTSNIDICSLLISRGADVNCRDEEGFTALHIAASLNHKECVYYLGGAGADVTTRNREGMNALICAAIGLYDMLVLDFRYQPGYSETDRIDALEILNASHVCAQNLNTDLWTDALGVRSRKNLPKACQVPAQELLDCSQEFTSVTELKVLQGDLLRLAYQSILIVERIIGRDNRVYIQFILQTALIAKQRNKKQKVRELIEHIQQYCEEASFVAANLFHFTNVFRVITESNNFFGCGGFTIFQIIAKAVIKMWFHVKDHLDMYPQIVDKCYSDLLDTFLYMTSKTNTLMVSSQHYLVEFIKVVKRVLDEDPRHEQYQSILHYAVKHIADKPWASVELILVLLESGANVTSKDVFGRTPVAYVIDYVPEHKRRVVLAIFKGFRGKAD